jgi:Flp pilus assembly secretin CpaC
MMKKCVAAICIALFFSGIVYGQQSGEASSEKMDGNKLKFVEDGIDGIVVAEKTESPAETPRRPHSNKSVVVEAKVVLVSLAELQKSDLESLHLQSEPKKDASPTKGKDAAGSSKSPSVPPDGAKMALVLDRLEREGSIKIVTSRRLWILDGCTGSIRCGRQFVNVPQRQKDGSMKLVKRPGPEMKATPTVSGDKINLHLQIQYCGSGVGVTATDPDGAPIGTIHECDTNLNLKNGEPFAVADSLETEVETHWSGVPFLSKTPIVGAMFRHVEETRSEIACFVVARATVVRKGASPVASSANARQIELTSFHSQ